MHSLLAVPGRVVGLQAILDSSSCWSDVASVIWQEGTCIEQDGRQPRAHIPTAPYTLLPNAAPQPYSPSCAQPHIMLFRRPKGYGTAQQVAVPMQQ